MSSLTQKLSTVQAQTLEGGYMRPHPLSNRTVNYFIEQQNMPFTFFFSPHKPLLWKHWKNNSLPQTKRNESSPHTSRTQPGPHSSTQCSCIASPQGPVPWQAVTEKPQVSLSPCTAPGNSADTHVQKTPGLNSPH